MVIAALLLVAGGFALQRLVSRRPLVTTENPVKRPPVAGEEETHLSFSVPGVVQSSSGATTVLRFQSGLFSQTVLLTSAGKETLAAVARQIEPHWRQLALTVVGHTDDLPIVRTGRFQDNEALAIARADAVIRYLSNRYENSGLRVDHSARTRRPMSLSVRLKLRATEKPVRRVADCSESVCALTGLC